MTSSLLIAKNKLIIALDVDDLGRARELAVALHAHVGMFKIGHHLFSRYGPAAVEMIHDLGGRVFLDLKYHDIPNTVRLAVEAAVSLKVAMLNVHSAGGRVMMTEAVYAAHQAAIRVQCSRPIVLGVTVLTSLAESDLEEVGMRGPVESQVKRLAALAHASGFDGVVASPQEIGAIRSILPPPFLIVTPGVRVTPTAHDDQKRTLSPAAALQAGADYLVVGRPILEAPDPALAAQNMVQAMAGS